MPIYTAQIIKRKRKSLFLSFLLLLTLPIFIFSLIENSSFDRRNRAFEDIEISEQNPCIITFPNINPYSIQVDSTVRVQVDALSKEYGVKSITISDSMNNVLLNKEYTDSLSNITESFPFTPQFPKAYNLVGTLVDTNNQTFNCVISSPYDVQGVKAISSNSKPIFTSTPRQSIPSQDITTGTTYEYTIEAEDVDGDTINYSYSFTSNETWLRSTVVEDGGNGKLRIKLQGSTNKAGSYLANIFIHDGYSTHLSSQSWVISVSPKENSNPSVKIIEPINPVQITKDPILTLRWEAEDDSEIVRYEIYISSNPTNQSSWQVIESKLNPSLNTYDLDFTNIPDGSYKIILRAIDNQIPEGIGMDISEEILLSKTEQDQQEPDDKVILPEPQVVNMSPTSTDVIYNTLPTIKASLVSAQGSSINTESIEVKIDDTLVTREVQINKISENEHTLIYIPTKPLSLGLHKVEIYFEDSQGESTLKGWTFNISAEDEQEDSDTFSLFGLEVPKRTTYIVMGGIGIVILAILVPMIIAALWKEESSKSASTNNYALPPSLPPTSLLPTVETQNKDLKELVNEPFETTTTEVEQTAPLPENITAPEPILEEPKKESKPTEKVPTQPNTPTLEPIIEESKPTQTPTVQPNITAPEPEEDLQSLYNQLEDLTKDSKKNTT